MDWIALGLAALLGGILFFWGRQIYAWPHKLYRYWHDTNRVHLALAQVTGTIMIFAAFLVMATVVVWVTGHGRSWQALLPVPVALLGAALFRPRETTKRPWHRAG